MKWNQGDSEMRRCCSCKWWSPRAIQLHGHCIWAQNRRFVYPVWQNELLESPPAKCLHSLRSYLISAPFGGQVLCCSTLLLSPLFPCLDLDLKGPLLALLFCYLANIKDSDINLASASSLRDCWKRLIFLTGSRCLAFVVKYWTRNKSATM